MLVVLATCQLMAKVLTMTDQTISTETIISILNWILVIIILLLSLQKEKFWNS
jgi:hypothetical protein